MTMNRPCIAGTVVLHFEKTHYGPTKNCQWQHGAAGCLIGIDMDQKEKHKDE